MDIAKGDTCKETIENLENYVMKLTQKVTELEETIKIKDMIIANNVKIIESSDKHYIKLMVTNSLIMDIVKSYKLEENPDYNTALKMGLEDKAYKEIINMLAKSHNISESDHKIADEIESKIKEISSGPVGFTKYVVGLLEKNIKKQ